MTLPQSMPFFSATANFAGGTLLALAKYPNIAVKATGQPGYAEDAYPFRTTCTAVSMRSGRTGCSGAPTSRGCRAPGGNA
jgi:hypothetical protein